MFKSKSKWRTFLVITLVLFFSMETIAVTNAGELSDISDNDWFYKDLKPLLDKGIVSGYPDRTFKAKNPLNLDEFIKMLVTTKDTTIKNADDYWAANYISYAKEYDWLNQVTMGYDEPVSRNTVCKIVDNYLSDSVTYPDNIYNYSSYITDYSSIPYNIKNSVLRCLSTGIITGYPDDSFSGSNILTRAEAAVIIHRLIDSNYRIIPLSIEESDELDELFSDTYYILENESLNNEIYFENNKIKLNNNGQLISINETRLSKPFVSKIEGILHSILVLDKNSDNTLDHYYLVDYNDSTISFTYYSSDSDVLIYRVYISIDDNAVNLMINQNLVTHRNWTDYYASFTNAITRELDNETAPDMNQFITSTMKELIVTPYAEIYAEVPFGDFTCTFYKEKLEFANFIFAQ